MTKPIEAGALYEVIMACNAEELRWLMEWAVFLLIVLAFGIAAAFRWAASPKPKEQP